MKYELVIMKKKVERNHNERHPRKSWSLRSDLSGVSPKLLKRDHGYSTPFPSEILNQVQHMFRDDARHKNLKLSK